MRKLIAVILVLALIGGGIYALWDGILKEQLDLYRYPIRFSEEIERAANENGIDPALIYAVIKTESDFEPDAVSRVNAKGLMQIIDDTNLWICEMSGKDPSADIFDPAVNIDRGAWLLAHLYRQFGSWNTALAAYNAGYGNVKKWLADEAYSYDGVELHTLPITETREYVKRVNEAYQKYNELYFEN